MYGSTTGGVSVLGATIASSGALAVTGWGVSLLLWVACWSLVIGLALLRWASAAERRCALDPELAQRRALVRAATSRRARRGRHYV